MPMSIPKTVNKPRRIRKGEPGYGRKKFVVLASEGGKKKTIRYGDANMKIRKSNPKARKSFRARHGCDEKPISKLSAKYWSCKRW
jgi:poly(3-hydroxybutyrate) depolymerase